MSEGNTPSRAIGRYQIIRECGKGGMGIVYVAFDPNLGRDVALKVLKFIDDESARRLLREGRVLGSLKPHKNIVTVHDAAVDSDGLPYLVMEFLEGGQDLEEALKKTPVMDVREALGIIEGVLAGLHHAHAEGIVHRDLKPPNIYLTTERVPKVLDFGLARPKDSLVDTVAGTIQGTWEYMSPEQTRGNRLEKGSDLFSVGSILFRMLEGHSPFLGATVPETAHNIQTKEPVFDKTPRQLRDVLSKALAKDPSRRFETAKEFASDISDFLAGSHRRFELVSAPQSDPLSDLGPEEWLKRIAGDPRSHEFAQSVLRVIRRRLTSDNSESERGPHLRHSKRVVDYLCRLIDVGADLPAPRLSFVLEKPELTTAILAAVVHNLGMMPRVPGLPRTDTFTYQDRARDFYARTGKVHALLVAEVDGFREELETVWHLALEMYRDSPYWGADNKDLKKHDEWLTSQSSTTRTIGGVLRMCDAMDVGHRIVPDLVVALFTQFDYQRGLSCYFLHTFGGEHGHLLPVSEPVLQGTNLELPWVSLPTSSPLHDCIVLAGQVVKQELEAIFRQIWRGHAPHPNLAIQVQLSREVTPKVFARPDELAWAMFPLALAQEPSDSKAAIRAADLVPLLVRYIEDGSTKVSSYTADQRAHVRRETLALLRLLKAVRVNSHAMRSTIEVFENALKGVAPESFRSTCERTSKELAAARAWHDLRAGIPRQWADRESIADEFYVHGKSKPVACWLAAMASKRRNRRTIIRPLYCVRHFLLEGASRNLFDLAPQLEHELMLDEVAEALREHDVPFALIEHDGEPLPSDRVCLIAPPLEMAMLPRQARKVEVLFGSRGVFLGPASVESVSVYRAHVLSLVATQLGIPVRIVTWEERLIPPFDPLDSTLRKGSFGFSYSAGRFKETEVDRVPIHQGIQITTELRTYSSYAVALALANRFSTNEPSTGPSASEGKATTKA